MIRILQYSIIFLVIIIAYFLARMVQRYFCKEDNEDIGVVLAEVELDGYGYQDMYVHITKHYRIEIWN